MTKAVTTCIYSLSECPVCKCDLQGSLVDRSVLQCGIHMLMIG